MLAMGHDLGLPALVTDPPPGPGTVAALTCLPSVSVHTSDDYPGADLVDLIASSLLSQGFELLAAFDPATRCGCRFFSTGSARSPQTDDI